MAVGIAWRLLQVKVFPLIYAALTNTTSAADEAAAALNLVPKTEMELQYEQAVPEPVVDGYMVLVYQVLCNVRRYSMPLQHDGFMQHVVLLFLTAYVLKYCDDVVLMVLYCLPQVRTWALSCTVHCSNTMPDGQAVCVSVGLRRPLLPRPPRRPSPYSHLQHLRTSIQSPLTLDTASPPGIPGTAVLQP